MSQEQKPNGRNRKWQISLLQIAAICILGFYSNCSKFSTINVDSQSLQLSSTNPLGDSNITGGSPAIIVEPNGTVVGFQDRQFKYELAGLLQGQNYSIVSGKPAWLQINATTGELTGTPLTASEFSLVFDIQKDGQTQRSNPVAFRIRGNPFKQYQWHIENTGQTTFARLAGTSGQDLNLKGTIAGGITGAGIRIAVSDTGLHLVHPGLSPNVIAGSRNYLTSNAASAWAGDPTPTVQSGQNDLAHGTAVSGIIAEKGWTDFGGRGVAPDASIAGFLFIQAQQKLLNEGLLTAAYLDQYQGNFDIFNYSWGDAQCASSNPPTGFLEKLKTGVTQLRSGKGAIYVKAAGNDFAVPLSYCYNNAGASQLVLGNANFSGENHTPYMILVGAYNARGTAASYSSPGANLWISAPGGETGSDTSTNNVLALPAILTTDFPGCALGIKSNQVNAFDKGGAPNTNCYHTSAMNGTSSAAPATTGAVALILQANPNLNWRDVKHILATTAMNIHSTAAATSHPQGLNLTGHTYEMGWITNAAGYRFHNWYGFGGVNVDAAVQLAKNYPINLGTQKETNTNNQWKYQSGVVNLSIPDNSATGASHKLTVTENWIVEAIQISPDIRNCIGQIGIELTSPSGTKSILMNINSGLQETNTTGATFLSNAFYGENSAGDWTIKVIDGSSTCQASLNNWKLNILGR